MLLLVSVLKTVTNSLWLLSFWSFVIIQKISICTGRQADRVAPSFQPKTITRSSFYLWRDWTTSVIVLWYSIVYSLFLLLKSRLNSSRIRSGDGDTLKLTSNKADLMNTLLNWMKAANVTFWEQVYQYVGGQRIFCL